ncbi:MAG: ATP-binding protein [Halioglobus sp.]
MEIEAVEDSGFSNILIHEREKIFDNLLAVLIFLSLAANIPATFNWLATGFRPSIFFGYLVSVVCIALLLLRNKIVFRIRVGLFQFTLTTFFISSALFLGYLTPLHSVPVLLTLTALLFLGKKSAILQLTICLTAYLFMLFNIGTPVLESVVSYEVATSSLAFKISYFATTAVACCVVFYAVRKHINILNNFSEKNLSLARENDVLIRAISEAPIGLAIWTSQGRLIFSTKEFDQRVHELDIPSLGELRFDDMVREAIRAKKHRISEEDEANWLAERIEGFYSGTWNHEYQMSDGSIVAATDTKISNGDIVSFRKDITALKQAEDKIRFITDNVSERIMTVDSYGKIAFANAGAELSFGISKSELEGTSVLQLFRGSFKEKIRDLLATRKSGDLHEQEFISNVECVGGDGTPFIVNVRCIPTQNTHGIELLMVIYDYSILTTDELRIKQLHEAIQKIGAGIALVAEDNKLAFFNSSFKSLVASYSQPILGMSFNTLATFLIESAWISSESRVDTVERLKAAYNTRGSEPVEFSTTGGIWLQVSVYHLSDESKLVVLIDVSYAKTLNEQLVQSSKLASLGEMATGIAHEINQPLNVIKLAAHNLESILSSEDSNNEAVGKRIRRILAQVDRAASIVDQMRVYGREAKETSSEANPIVCLNEAVEMVSSELALENIHLTKHEPAHCPSVKIHPIKLVQVLVVLINNAKDAFADNNTVETSRNIVIDIEALDRKEVNISVSDNAGGIPAAIISKVMDPFFTTKDPGRGTGLGLSIASRILTDANGKLLVKNTKGGANFTITLPEVD